MALRIRHQVTPELLAVPEQTIAALARRFLVDPFSENVGPDLSGLTAEGKDALANVATALGVSVDAIQSSDGELRSQVVELLVEVLKRSSLQNSRGKAAKEGLGEAGLLPPGQYSIEFNDLFREFESLGLRKAHVEQVMRAPHLVQHLSAKGEDGQAPGLSLFARSIQPSKGKDFLQLVIASRNGSQLNFAGAWRIYRELVSWDSSQDLLSVLGSFVSVYGIPFSVADSEALTFAYYRDFQLPTDFRGPPSATAKTVVRVMPDENKDQSYLANFAWKMGPDRTMTLLLGFVVDTNRYEKDISRFTRK